MAAFLTLRNCLNKCPFKTRVSLQSLKARPLRDYDHTRGFMQTKHPRENPKHTGYTPQDHQIVLKTRQSTGNHIPLSRLFKPFIFTVTFTGTAFSLAAIAEHERKKKQIYQYSPTKRVFAQRQYGSFWQQLSDGQKVYTVIASLNLAVFACCRIPGLNPIMSNYFHASPVSKGLCSSMILSTFTHYSPLHLFINMYVLYSFVTNAVPVLGREQFTAMYLSAGVFSNLTSYLYKILVNCTKPSVGASGAIAGVLGYIASRFPEAKFHIVFVPQFVFSAGPALKIWLTCEAIACGLRLQFLDHAGHFGGGIFGVFWDKLGQEHLWTLRGHVIKQWEALKKCFRDSTKFY